MRSLRLAVSQINATVGELDANASRVAHGIERARAAGVELLVFPEMVIPGYLPEDLLLKPAFIERVMETTRGLAALTRGMTVLVGTLERDVDLYNAAAVLHDGAWVTSCRKRYLPNYGVFDENRYFMPERRSPVVIRNGIVLGVSVCEDIWYPGGPVEEQIIAGGAELIVNLSASPYHAGKAQARRRMLCTRAADNLAVLCYANLVGGQDELVFDGGSLVVDEQGTVLAEGEMFDEDFLAVDVELDGVFSSRLHDPRLRKERALAQENGATAAPAVTLAPVPAPARPAIERRVPLPTRDAISEVYDALVFGTRDYVHKNGFKEVALGLSGGIDSALVACVAADAVGPRHVIGVSLPSEVTSAASRADAEALAQSLGIRLITLPIAVAVQAHESLLAESFAGRAPDATEENLQARVRGTLLMALSNKLGWLVLVTGNKSEIAVGYNTLYGDTAGGFAVLKDVYKTDVYQLAQHRNRLGGAPVIPEYTLTRPPSAELRAGQTDQDSLPPYDVLDPILRYYLEEDRPIADIVALGFDEKTVRRVVELVAVSEWKRRQMPPGVKVSPRAFGKDWRMPITDRWRG